jgi:hypothetical protein
MAGTVAGIGVGRLVKAQGRPYFDQVDRTFSISGV